MIMSGLAQSQQQQPQRELREQREQLNCGCAMRGGKCYRFIFGYALLLIRPACGR